MRFFPSKRLIFALLALIWFEWTFLPLFSIGKVRPDFFAIFIVYYAFRISWKRVVGLAFLAGLLQDVVTNSFFGLETASYVGGAILLRFLVIQFDRDKLWIHLAGLFCFTWTVLHLFWIGKFLIGPHLPWEEWIWIRMFLISVYTTAIAAVAYPFFDRWLRPVLRPKQYELF